MPPPSTDKGIRKPPRPLKAKSKRAPKSQANAPKYQAEAPKYQAEAPKSQAEAPKYQADARERLGKTLAPWAQSYKQLPKPPNHPAEAQNLPDDPIIDTYTSIKRCEVNAVAKNGSDGDTVAGLGNNDIHTGQMCCVTRWACPECRHRCLTIQWHIQHNSSTALIQSHINELRKHLINSSTLPS